jgi:hypothetical protein
LNKLLKALCENRSLEDAVKKLASPAKYARFRRDRDEQEMSCFEKVIISEHWAGAFGWLWRCISNKVSEEEAWWNCAWLFTESEMKTLREIEKCVRERTPPLPEQTEYLNEFLRLGHPEGIWAEYYTEEGAFEGETYKIVLKSEQEYMNLNDLTMAAFTLLIPPAFLLAQQLQQQCSKLRFIVQCRAPSCGKRFYTGRENATSCPSKRSDAKSPCALEWVRYKRYLEKVGRDPEKDWNKAELEEQFISYDQS